MWNRDQIDLGHTEDRTAYVGLEHRRCNRGEAATRGNQQRGFLPVAGGSDVICQICYRPYHYAAKACEMCGGHYHPTYGQQRTCSRPCGVQLQRRNRMATGWLPKDQRPKPPPKLRKPGPVQSGEREPKNGWPSSPLQHYTCRYCGKPGVTKGKGQPREVCTARACQLARLAANRLCARQGLSREAADAHVKAVMGSGNAVMEQGTPTAYGRWSARRW